MAADSVGRVPVCVDSQRLQTAWGVCLCVLTDACCMLLVRDSDCMWRIESVYQNMTVRVDVVDSKLEHSLTCLFDSVTVYDGGWLRLHTPLPLPLPPLAFPPCVFTIISHPLKGGRGFLMSPSLPCLESQGPQFDPTLLYLLSCSSA